MVALGPAASMLLVLLCLAALVVGSANKVGSDALKSSLFLLSGADKMPAKTHCSKSSFFVQKFNFDFHRQLSIFWGEKLVKMLWF